MGEKGVRNGSKSKGPGESAPANPLRRARRLRTDIIGNRCIHSFVLQLRFLPPQPDLSPNPDAPQRNGSLSTIFGMNPRVLRESPLLPAGDLGQEVDLGIGRDRLEPGVLVDLAVDGHRQALL